MAKDNLASRVLLQQEASRRFPEVSDTEVRDRLDKLIAQAGSEEQFYMNIGMPVKDESMIRDNVAGGVRLDKMLSEVYEPDPEPTDEEMHAWFEKNIKLYLTDERIRASHISMNLSGAHSRTETYNLMRDLRKKAQAGEDFDAMGREHNSNKENPPDLGWFKRGEFMEEFESIAFSMDENEVSPVFSTPLGLHICKLTGREPAVPKPFDEVKDNVRQRMIEEHRDQKFNVFVDELKKNANIQDTDPDDGCGCGGH
jgi:hypothetical protein